MAELITKIKNRSGQSIVEILVALSIGALIIGAAVLSISVALRSNTANVGSSFASPLAKELIEKVRIIAEGNWTDVYNQPKGADLYIITDTGGAQKIIAGEEGIASNDIQNGLVGYWKLDEDSGTTAYDASANNNQGEITNGPVSELGRVGGALKFDGSNDYVRIPHSASLDLTGSAITVTAWFRRDAAVNWQRIVGKQFYSGSDTGSWRIMVLDTNKVNCWINRSGSTSSITPNPVVVLGEWMFAALVYDGTTFNCYLNSTSASPVNATGNISTSTYPVTIGTTSNGTSTQNHWNGLIDDVRIYNRALSSAEVFHLYNSRSYTRSFKIENVSRDGSGNIQTIYDSTKEDPSTQKITATVSWGTSSNLTISEYITRNRNDVTQESDWSGGNFDSGASEAIDASTPGEIKLAP